MDPELFENYYNGCCNGTHWPLFHSMPGKIKKLIKIPSRTS